MIRQMSRYIRLARWLGPWGSQENAPDVLREEIALVPREQDQRDHDVKVWRFSDPSQKPVGAYVIAPGLHFDGPADPRFERFARVLAHAGFEVWAPFIPDYLDLRIRPDTFEDFERVFDAARQSPASGGRPAVFSISFGSLLALRLAGHPELGPSVSNLIVFGGYRDWLETALFCITGEVDGERLGGHDPLNLPVLFIQALDQLVDDPSTAAALQEAWRTYMQSTWGREEMKVGGRHLKVARSVAADVDKEIQELFLIGCGATPGARELLRPVLEGPTLGHLDPGAALDRIQCPVHLFHGVDDDVIPWTQLASLERSLPDHLPVQSYLTGLYGHTTSGGVERTPVAMAKELATMGKMLATLANAGIRAR